MIVAIPLMVAAFYGTQRHYRRVARRLRAGVDAVAAAPPATNDVVLYVESIDAALREALWYAHTNRGRRLPRHRAPGRSTDPGLRARFRRTDEHPARPRGAADEDGRVEAVIEYLWALPHGESQFVTVVVPELFDGVRSLAALTRDRVLAQAAASRSSPASS